MAAETSALFKLCCFLSPSFLAVPCRPGTEKQKDYEGNSNSRNSIQDVDAGNSSDKICKSDLGKK